MYMETMKKIVAGLALVSFASAPVLAADGAPTEIKPVGLFSKKVEDCAKDAKNGKKNGKKNGDKKAGCDDDKGAKKNGCDVGCGDGECNLLERYSSYPTPSFFLSVTSYAIAFIACSEK